MAESYMAHTSILLWAKATIFRTHCAQKMNCLWNSYMVIWQKMWIKSHFYMFLPAAEPPGLWAVWISLSWESLKSVRRHGCSLRRPELPQLIRLDYIHTSPTVYRKSLTKRTLKTVRKPTAAGLWGHCRLVFFPGISLYSCCFIMIHWVIHVSS